MDEGREKSRHSLIPCVSGEKPGLQPDLARRTAGRPIRR
jgi:hypothetical protein